MTPTGYKVPVHAGRKNKHEAVWQYLETVEEYETMPQLRQHLIEKFGAENVPSKSGLHRHLQANWGKRNER